MWAKIVSLLLLGAVLTGCSAKHSAASSMFPGTQPLPPEVTGAPEEALPKQNTEPSP